MSGWMPPRLRPILARDLDEVTADELEKLIGLQEDTDLEFKSEPWGTSDSQKKECAFDIADKANAGGGLIVIGVEEDGTGRAAAISPVATASDLALRAQQIVANRVSPPVEVSHRVVVAVGGEVHLFSVPPSRRAPHAVMVGNESMRYPVRAGTTRRWMSEPEVATAYHRRMAGIEQAARRLDHLHKVGRATIPSKEQDNDPWVWLLVTLTPDVPGDLSLRRGLAEDWRDWLNQSLTQFPSFRRHAVSVRPGFRCLRVADGGTDREEAYSVGGQLHLDGSGSLFTGHPGGKGSRGTGPEVSVVYDEHLLGDLVNLLATLGEHAIRSGATGDVQVAAEMLPTNEPMAIGQYRSSFPGPLAESGTVIRSTGVSTSTFPLETLTPGPDLVAAVRLLLLDLGSAFGLAEPQQITEDLALVRNRFTRERAPAVETWAAHAGVEIVKDLG